MSGRKFRKSKLAICFYVVGGLWFVSQLTSLFWSALGLASIMHLGDKSGMLTKLVALNGIAAIFPPIVVILLGKLVQMIADIRHAVVEAG